jgi:predicted CXXCH cytochrome family protein
MAENPNPGSREAVALGCTCAVMDNHHGAGFPWGPEGKICFWMDTDCPLHGAVRPDECSRCHGNRGGIRGNENIVDGVILCDYCHSDDLTG